MTTPNTQPTTDEVSDLDFYKKALERIAAELGIVHPVQLMAESVKGETYVDVLVKILRNQLAKLREENEKAIGTEQARWQEAIRSEVLRISEAKDIDGSACDSGDPLDLSLAEIVQGIVHIQNQRDELRTQNELLQSQLNRCLTTLQTIAHSSASEIQQTLNQKAE